MSGNVSNSIIYRVTGRYMDGAEVTGYHVVGSDGTSLPIGRDKAILMTSRGQIENLRVQYSGDTVIIRGNGVNLNTLPVFDTNREQFRGNNTPNRGTTPKTSQVNPMAQYKITKRIMYKTQCIGYQMQDAAGHVAKLNRNKVIEFAVKGLILNAEVQKYTPKDSTETKLILRGVRCDLKELPIIIVDQNGKEVDTTKTNQSMVGRATKMRKGGIIYNNEKNSKLTFEPGDYIICTPLGALSIMHEDNVQGHMKKSIETTPICDTYLDNLKNYPVELFGAAMQCLTPQLVTRWPVVEIVK